MSRSPQEAAREVARAGMSRQRILELLRATPGGLGVQELAERTGLHGNTVRFHLDRLVTDGLVERQVAERTRPGRPPLTFTATAVPDQSRDRRNYQWLAEILTGHLAGTTQTPAAVAVELGRTWGRYLAERPVPYRRVDEEEAVGRLLQILDEIGFAPRLAADDPRRILIPNCPFREVAAAHREIVCSIHLGLMQGALAEMGAPVTADRLLPFVEPTLCEAHLAPSGRTPDGPPAGR
jgi:predicted ArsR family transcriptional regulator